MRDSGERGPFEPTHFLMVRDCNGAEVVAPIVVESSAAEALTRLSPWPYGWTVELYRAHLTPSAASAKVPLPTRRS